jgi:hypothetical protein
VATLIDDTTAGDTDYIRGILNGATTQGLWDFTDMPADFESMTSVSVEIRHSRGGVEGGDNGGGDDTHNLNVALMASDQVTNYTTLISIESSTIGYLVKTETVDLPLTAAGLAASQADWNSALMRVLTTFNINMAADGDRIWVDFARLINGVYVASGPSVNDPFPYVGGGYYPTQG